MLLIQGHRQLGEHMAEQTRAETADTTSEVRLHPIDHGDLREVAQFLSAHLDDRIDPETWHGWLTPEWAEGSENRGFLLRDGERLVGAYVAYYVTRNTPIGPVRFCNLADWAVLDEYRSHSLRLALAIVKQPGLSFTDLTPRPEVRKINRRLGFVDLDVSAFLAINVPCLPLGPHRIVDDEDAILAALDDTGRRHYLDHRHAHELRQLAIVGGERPCLVMYRVTGHPVNRLGGRKLATAFVSYVSDREVFAAAYGRLSSHLLARGIPLTSVEHRVAGFAPRMSRPYHDAHPKQFKAPGLAPEDIDYLYSEILL